MYLYIHISIYSQYNCTLSTSVNTALINSNWWSGMDFTFPHTAVSLQFWIICLLHSNTIICLLHSNTIICLLHNNTIICLLHNITVTFILVTTIYFMFSFQYTLTSFYFYCSLTNKIISTKRKSWFLP